MYMLIYCQKRKTCKWECNNLFPKRLYTLVVHLNFFLQKEEKQFCWIHYLVNVGISPSILLQISASKWLDSSFFLVGGP